MWSSRSRSRVEEERYLQHATDRLRTVNPAVPMVDMPAVVREHLAVVIQKANRKLGLDESSN